MARRQRNASDNYHRFASALANYIAENAMAATFKVAQDKMKDFNNEVYNQYLRPHQKVMKKLPEDFFKRVGTFDPDSGQEHLGSVRLFPEGAESASYGVSIVVPVDTLVPEFLTVPPAVFEQSKAMINAYNAQKKRVEILAREIYTSIDAAETIDEIKMAWPETAEKVDELATLHGVVFQKNLAKILGKHVPDQKALPKK